MHEFDSDLADALAKADESLLREILREAERFLQSQLQAALASDHRALTFAGILAAAIALIVGACATLASVGQIKWLALTVAPMVSCFLAALHYAAKAAEPCRFEYVGNDPAEWVVDIEAPNTKGCGG